MAISKWIDVKDHRSNYSRFMLDVYGMVLYKVRSLIELESAGSKCRERDV
jgi:hypothetical protein